MLNLVWFGVTFNSWSFQNMTSTPFTANYRSNVGGTNWRSNSMVTNRTGQNGCSLSTRRTNPPNCPPPRKRLCTFDSFPDMVAMWSMAHEIHFSKLTWPSSAISRNILTLNRIVKIFFKAKRWSSSQHVSLLTWQHKLKHLLVFFCINLVSNRAVVMAQLIKLLLPILVVRSLNPVIGKISYWTFNINCNEKTKIKKQR